MEKITGKSKFNIKKLPHRIVNDEKRKEYSKLFVTMDHKTLIQKLEKKHQYIDRFKVYLNSWNQYVSYSQATTLLEKIKCVVPQGFPEMC